MSTLMKRGSLSRRRSLIAVAAASALALASCGEGRPAGAGPDAIPVAGEDVTRPPMNWDGLIVNGIPSTEAAAGSNMAFDVVVPSLLGEPTRVEITDPESAPAEFRVAGFAYDDPVHGRFWVLEAVAEMSQEELESWLVCDPKAGCEGLWTLAVLPGGIRGVLIQGPTATSVVWLDAGRRFDVVGPAKTLNGTSAMDVASAVVKSELNFGGP